jgi:uncharacterized protein
MSSSSDRVLLLVDGYNIIGHWSELKISRDCHGLETARDRLIECLVNYAAAMAYETKIVFDAHYQNTPGTEEKHSALLSVQFTSFAETADSYIEKFCAGFSHNRYRYHCSRLIVATSDRAQQLTVVGYGAEWRSAQMLAGEVAAATSKTRQKKQTKKPSSRLLFYALDPASQKRLKQWQRGGVN